MLKVGYIGLGLMGKSIARNILRRAFLLWSTTVHAGQWMSLLRKERRPHIRRRKLPNKWM
jgi:3-hydroxyisobutyrate dehydrogenase-like beta-hydroxyacid dehydrogenase